MLTLVALQDCQGQAAYSLQCEHKPIKAVIAEIEETYSVYFSFKEDDLTDVKVSKTLEGVKDLSKFIDLVLADTELTFTILDQQFVILTKQDPERLEMISLCGYLKDALSGVPLQGANITLGSTGYGASTNALGYFACSVPKESTEVINGSYIGYKSIEIDPNQEGCDTYELSYDDEAIPYLVITDYVSDGIVLDSKGATSKLTPRGMSMLPGQIDADILQGVSFLPGVSSPTSAASDIRIRGGSPDQNLILWESIPIYHSAHYFGMLTAFNPYIMSSVDVYRGGFGPEYGGRVAGVIDMKSRDLTETFTGVGLDMVNAYVYGNQTLGSDKHTQVAFSLRRSYSELGETPTLNRITQVNQQGLLLGAKEIELLPDHITIANDYQYLDAQLQVKTQLSDRMTLTLAGTYADNAFEDYINDDRREEDQRDTMVLTNKGGSLSLTRKASAKAVSELKLIGTAFEQSYDYRIKGFDESNPRLDGHRENSIRDLQAHLSHKHTFMPNKEVQFGYQFTDYAVSYQVLKEERNGQDVKDDGNDQSQLHSVFAEYTHPLTKALTLDLGLRSSYFVLRDQWYLAPRIRLDWRLADHFTLNAYVGRHQQFISQLSVFRGSDTGISTPLWLLSNKNSAPVQQSMIGQVGAVYAKDSWVVDLQAYRKRVDGLSSRAYDSDIIPANVGVVGHADIAGIDILVKKRFKHVRTWLSYSLSDNVLTYPELSDQAFSSDFNQRHIFQLSGQVILGRLQCALGYQYSSGLPYTDLESFDTVTMSGQTVEYIGNYGEVNASTLNPLKEVNASVQYQINESTKSWKGVISASVTNILNTTNVYARNYTVDEGNQQSDPEITYTEKSNLKFTPNISLRLEF